MKTYVPTRDSIQRDWWIVDADGLTLGRLATQIATRLRGKHKVTFTPHLDVGDHVIVVNAKKVHLTGNKWADKKYRRHSGYPGGLKEITAEKLRDRHPERLIEFAVRGMLPNGPLGRQMARKLKVYGGDKHPHDAQQPKAWTIAVASASR
ncbi:MAG: 50S ribosomal protein L13 [Acidobacteriota bacterium]|nr:50S ribosomal protein L13 [Acidobacteriota bacterium]MDH3785398.1 50S ribosomal protein L13 [Acidobacteriota bacterium]